MFDREIEEIQNSSNDYNIYKYRGPDYLSSIQKIRNIRVETINNASLDINELQVWAKNHNYVQGRSENYIAQPTHSFILAGNTRSLTDKNSSNVLTLNGSPTFNTDGINLTGTEYIDIPQEIIGFGNNDFTVSIWIKNNGSYNSTEYRNIISFGWENHPSLTLIVNKSGIVGDPYQGAEVIINYMKPDGTSLYGGSNYIFGNDTNDHNFIISRKSGVVRLSIDGVFKHEVNFDYSLPIQNFYIGRNNNQISGQYFIGNIKKLDIWNGVGFD